MSTSGKLIFLCGKMAAGKSTLAQELAHRENAVLLVQDELLDAPDALCKEQLKERSKRLPAGSPWTTESEFKAITVYFQPPSDDEGFNVVRHERA